MITNTDITVGNKVSTNTDFIGLEVDTFKDLVLLEDTDYGHTAQLTIDQALTLANRLIRAAKKAELYLK